MAYIKGKKAVLQFYKDGDYVNFLCATDCSIEFTTETKDVRTIGDGIWKKKRGQSKAWTVSLNGLIELQETSPVAFWLIKNYDFQMLPAPMRMVFTDDDTALVTNITGNVLFVKSTLNGVATGFAGSSFSMEGDGAPVITDSTTICEATIGEITAGYDPDSENVIINYTDVVGAFRLEYSVDGGGRIPVFSPGTDGFFFIAGLSDGPHTVQIWAVCENAIDGESNTIIFEVTGGEPGPACEIPGAITMSDLTGTAGTATWVEPGSPPAGGYLWELLGPLMTVLQSGNTSDLFTNLTGLIDGVTYTFRVKSLCEEGVSESSFSSTMFTSAAACSAPGTPSMSAVASTTATASWSAASPTPTDGYSWQVLQGVTVVASGTTASTSVGITGLTANTDYAFEVKSLCETGVSESGYVTADFTTEAASCPNPGPVFVDTFGLDPGDANAHWSASSPPPADGYEWQLIRLSDLFVVDSGTTTSTTVNMTGLTSLEEYQFQVRSVCITGLSYSAYRTRNFTST